METFKVQLSYKEMNSSDAPSRYYILYVTRAILHNYCNTRCVGQRDKLAVDIGVEEIRTNYTLSRQQDV